MSNASSCRRVAADYARQAACSGTPEERRAFRELERLWSEMATVAERFDREHDDAAKVEIYAMMEEVEAARQKVA